MANMKKIFIALMVIGLTFTAITAYADLAKDAVMALKKLQARCQVGISYRDYSNAVADAKFPVNLFMESEETKKFPVLTYSMNKVMKHYENAGSIWNERISQGNKFEVMNISSLQGSEMKKLYPKVVETNGFYLFEALSPAVYPGLLPIIWEEASKELEKAALYMKIEEDTAKDKGDISNDIDKLKKENANLKKQLELLKSKKTK